VKFFNYPQWAAWQSEAKAIATVAAQVNTLSVQHARGFSPIAKVPQTTKKTFVMTVG
jgi:hypothetical protein